MNEPTSLGQSVCRETGREVTPDGRLSTGYDDDPAWKVGKDRADYEEGVRCVVMPCCGFTYDAIHVTTDDDYVCPLCAPVTEVPQHG